jgi:acyl transferase domain-containing protein
LTADPWRDVAIVGMACRFPDAPDPLALWRNILARRASFREVPAERWDHSLFYDPKGKDPNSTYSRRAAFVEGVDRFAGPHFKIAPRQAQMMDPQQRLTLEVVREALQDAGLEERPYDRSRTAVLLGASISEYGGLATLPGRARQMAGGQFGAGLAEGGRAQVSRVAPCQSYTLPGSLLSMIATSVSRAYDLGGPACTIDAACASSLVAVIQAVHYLRSLPPSPGPAPLALAGGVYLQLVPDCMVGFARIGALAPDDCRPFDPGSAGFLLGEGVGVVVLKRLAQARADGDRIYAVLRGVAQTSDGRTDSPMTPRVEGQERVLRLGLQDAGVPASSIGYIECHGTGTRAGDSVELEALARVMGAGPHLGSIKANLGHALSAAGVAGLMRAALALHHRTLPPQTNWERWHPELERFAEFFTIDTRPRPWEAPVRRAAVSSFGFGGANAFAVLEEEPAVQAPVGEPCELRPSAATPALLRQYLQALRPYLRRADAGQLGRAAYTLSLRSTGSYGAALRPADGAQADHLVGRLLEALESPPEGVIEVAPGALLGPTEQLPPPGPIPAWARRLVSLPFVPLERLSYWVVKPPAPAPPPGPFEVRLGLETHPYLGHHQVGGRSILPLAAALDLFAWSQDLRPPFALGQIRVHRGLALRGEVTVRVHRDGDDLRLVEVRPTGRESLAYTARLLASVPLPPEDLEAGAPRSLPWSLEEFYARRTFHGPLLQGIVSLEERRERSLSGIVRTSAPAELAPAEGRSAWHVDPLAIDSGLQMGIYWSQVEAGHLLLPLEVEEMALLEPFGSGPVRALMELEEAEGPQARGQVRFYGRGRLLGWLAGVRARVVAGERALAPAR